MAVDAVPETEAGQVASLAERQDGDHENFAALATCATALEGVTVLPKPRVSREAMVDVLKDHNNILEGLRRDLGSLFSRVDVIAAEAKQTRAMTEAMQVTLGEHKQTMKTLSDRTDAVEKVTEALAEKLTLIDELSRTLKVHDAQIGDLQTDVAAEKKTNAEFREDASSRIEDSASRVKVLEEQQEKMQDRLDHLNEDIQISSDQVTYTREREAGEDVDDDDLEVVLTSFITESKQTVTKHTKVLEVQRKALRNHGDELERKAGVEMEAVVGEHDEHLKRIQAKLDADADIDLTDIRRNQEIITGTLEGIQADMLEKTDKKEVDKKIDVKYEEILDHLQTALNATEEDEEDFKAATEALNGAVDELKSAKADKKDLVAFKKTVNDMVNSGQLGGGGDASGGASELVGQAAQELEARPTREEVVDMLDDKVDRGLFDAQSLSLKERVSVLKGTLTSLLQALLKGDGAKLPSAGENPLAGLLNALNAEDDTQGGGVVAEEPRTRPSSRQAGSRPPSRPDGQADGHTDPHEATQTAATGPETEADSSLLQTGKRPPSSKQNTQTAGRADNSRDPMISRMATQIAELQSWIVHILNTNKSLQPPGEGVFRQKVSGSAVHCLSCDQPIVNSGRFQQQPGHTLGGGYSLRSPAPRDHPSTSTANVNTAAPLREGANASLPEIDREAFFTQQRDTAMSMMGVEGIDGKFYRADTKYRKRNVKSRDGGQRERPMSSSSQGDVLERKALEAK